MNKDQKEYLVQKLKNMKPKEVNNSSFTKKKDWKEFRIKINKEKNDE